MSNIFKVNDIVRLKLHRGEPPEGFTLEEYENYTKSYFKIHSIEITILGTTLYFLKDFKRDFLRVITPGNYKPPFPFKKEFLKKSTITRVNYKVGDIVKVRNLNTKKAHSLSVFYLGSYSPGWNPEMAQFCNKIYKISSISPNGFISLTFLDGTVVNYSWAWPWLLPKKIKH